MAAIRAEILLTALPDARSAHRLADLLVRRKVAACVTAVPGAVSTYSWKGRIERSRETLVLAKTLRKNYPKAERLIRENHPYELPEILRIPASGGSAGYLSWLCRNS